MVEFGGYTMDGFDRELHALGLVDGCWRVRACFKGCHVMADVVLH